MREKPNNFKQLNFTKGCKAPSENLTKIIHLLKHKRFFIINWVDSVIWYYLGLVLSSDSVRW